MIMEMTLPPVRSRRHTANVQGASERPPITANKPTGYPRAVFVLTPSLQESVNNRTREGESVHQTARADLERYYTLLDDGRKILAGMFTADEIGFIFDVGNGMTFEPLGIKYLPAELQAMKTLAEKWEIDAASVAERVRSLPPCATYALVDAVERWFIKPSGTPDAAGLMGIGIVPSSD